MPLRDLFRPKWKHSDESVRYSAVLTLRNQDALQALIEVAKTDPSERIRILAVSRIRDPEAIVDIATNSPYNATRKRAVEKVDDESILARIAIKDPEQYIRLTALKKIKTELLLVEIARETNEPSMRNKAVDSLTDMSILVELATNQNNFQLREAATRKINDQSILEKIIEKDNTIEVRLAAIKNLQAPSILARLRTHPDPRIRRAVILKTSDQNELARMAREDPDESVRSAAIDSVKDQTLLVAIANGESSSVRARAAQKISDLRRAAEKSNDEAAFYERVSLVRKMTSLDQLLDIVENDLDAKVRKIASETIEALPNLHPNTNKKDRKALTLIKGGHKKCDRCGQAHKWWVAKTLTRSPLQAQFSGTSLPRDASGRPLFFSGACQKCEDVFCTDHAWDNYCLICESELYS